MDLPLPGNWVWPGITIAVYFLCSPSELTYIPWAKDTWFLGNDVLRISLMLWILYSIIVIAYMASDSPIINENIRL